MKKTMLWDGDIYTKNGLIYRFRLSHLFWAMTWISLVLALVQYHFKVEQLTRRVFKKPFPDSEEDYYDHISSSTVLLSSTNKHFFEISICDLSDKYLPNTFVGPVVLDKGRYAVTSIINEPLGIFGFSLDRASEWESDLHFTHLNLPQGAQISRASWARIDEEPRVLYMTNDSNGTLFGIRIVRRER